MGGPTHHPPTPSTPHPPPAAAPRVCIRKKKLFKEGYPLTSPDIHAHSEESWAFLASVPSTHAHRVGVEFVRGARTHGGGTAGTGYIGHGSRCHAEWRVGLFNRLRQRPTQRGHAPLATVTVESTALRPIQTRQSRGQPCGQPLLRLRWIAYSTPYSELMVPSGARIPAFSSCCRSWLALRIEPEKTARITSRCHLVSSSPCGVG